MNRNQIANLALSNLGQTIPIGDFETDTTPQGRTIKQWFQVALESLLRQHPWAFARTFAALPVGLSTPSAGYAYAFQYPADALVIRRLAPQGKFPLVDVSEEYARRWIEVNVGTGTEIWTNVPEAHADYTVNISPDYDFPMHFSLALSYHLALVTGPKIISNKWPQMINTFIPNAQNEIEKCISDDLAMQPEAREMDSSFIQVRRGY